jgi:hypothetical protein
LLSVSYSILLELKRAAQSIEFFCAARLLLFLLLHHLTALHLHRVHIARRLMSQLMMAWQRLQITTSVRGRGQEIREEVIVAQAKIRFSLHPSLLRVLGRRRLLCSFPHAARQNRITVSIKLHDETLICFGIWECAGVFLAHEVSRAHDFAQQNQMVVVGKAV